MIKNPNTVNWQRGFTLVEVVVVMAIIAVLAVLVVGAINIARNTAKETVHRSNARTLETGMQAYYAKNRTGPPSNYPQAYTFTELADILDVQLASTPDCEGESSWAKGGGGVWINGSTQDNPGNYAIIPYVANCPADPPNEMSQSDWIFGSLPLPPGSP